MLGLWSLLLEAFSLVAVSQALGVLGVWASHGRGFSSCSTGGLSSCGAWA